MYTYIFLLCICMYSRTNFSLDSYDNKQDRYIATLYVRRFKKLLMLAIKSLNKYMGIKNIRVHISKS